MIIREYVVKVATEDSISDRDVERALEDCLNTMPAAAEILINQLSARKTHIDQGVDPQSTIEENDKWAGLANKELNSRG